MTAFTCPHCGGPIAYDPSSEAMTCSYCDSVINIPEYRQHLAASKRLLLNELSCPQCGAELLTTDVTTATFCSYCGSSVALESRLVEEDMPKSIIPFKFGVKRAKNIYKNKIHTTLLAPDWMEDADALSHFRGIYMPFHVFSYGWHGYWSGETSQTKLQRIGGVEYDVTSTYQTDAEVDVEYSYIPQDASTAFPDAMSRAVCPYKKQDEVPFDLSYYGGFYADKGDVPSDLYEEKYANLVIADVANSGDISCGKVSVPAAKATKDMALTPKVENTMFPVWFLSIRKKDKVNYACVNGDTGELVCDIPIDFKKFLKASIIVAGIFSLILNLTLTLKPNNMLGLTAILALIAFVVAGNLLNNTYRREKRYDDPGYTGEDHDQVKVRRGAGSKARSAGVSIIVATAICMVITIFMAYIDEEGLFVGMFVMTAMIGLPIYIIVAVVNSVKGKNAVKTKRKKAPLYYKLLVMIKPAIAICLAVVVILAYPEVDEYCYIAAMINIAMIIWTAFDVVFAQNRFSMRDLPIFNEKRGGEA